MSLVGKGRRREERGIVEAVRRVTLMLQAGGDAEAGEEIAERPARKVEA
jgi:hypothetical protein